MKFEEILCTNTQKYALEIQTGVMGYTLHDGKYSNDRIIIYQLLQFNIEHLYAISGWHRAKFLTQSLTALRLFMMPLSLYTDARTTSKIRLQAFPFIFHAIHYLSFT
jgi:hypothetical protein